MGKMKTRARKSEIVYLNRKWALLILLLLTAAAWAYCGSSAGSVRAIRLARTKAEPIKPLQYKPFDDTNEKTDNWTTVRMRVTAYCPCSKCCGKHSDGITASGHKICRGDTFIAADKRYSFDTEMTIPGYGNTQPVKVLDRGGAIRGNRLDVFFRSHKKALKWGVRYLNVKVII
jgi:3D (Asp-Asp-Asp) domain-containing protein